MSSRSIEVPGGTVQSWVVGDLDGPGTPMLFLHGGPGGSCRGFDSLHRLAEDRPLVMLDQLGSPSSNWSGEPDELWSIDRFCEEVDVVRSAWGLDEVLLFGHSWGGWLATDYLCRGAAGVTAAVFADTAASFDSFAASIDRRVAELSPSAQHAVAAFRAGAEDLSGETGERYREAALEFYDSFVVRNVPGNDMAASVFDRQRSTEVFRHMQGHDELHADGSLRTWDRRCDLASVTTPSLVIVGRHDHMDPATAAEIADALPNGELVVFDESSHCPHLEQPDDVVDHVASWLAQIER